MDKPNLIVMVGLPASGKSTYAKDLAESCKAVLCSSDAIREELYGNESIQGDKKDVFGLLHKRVKDNLKQGKNVIYDATNISSKKRRAFLSELKKIPCKKECLIMATPFDECLKANENRDRKVPYADMLKMYKNWNTPYWFEGWDVITIKHRTPPERSPEKWVQSVMDFNQDNPHHEHTLGKHCLNVAEYLSELNNETLYYAGLLHDLGKPFTKKFKDLKGEKCDIAHYYHHHCTGAYDSLFFSYPKNVNWLDVSVLINLHMKPFDWEKNLHGDKTINKYKELWGNELFEKVISLHIADKNCSKAKEITGPIKHGQKEEKEL